MHAACAAACGSPSLFVTAPPLPVPMLKTRTMKCFLILLIVFQPYLGWLEITNRWVQSIRWQQYSPSWVWPEEMETGFAGLPAVADPKVSLDVAMKYAARRPVAVDGWNLLIASPMVEVKKERNSQAKGGSSAKSQKWSNKMEFEEGHHDPEKKMDGPYYCRGKGSCHIFKHAGLMSESQNKRSQEVLM